MEAGKCSSIPANQPSRQQNSRQSVTMYNGVNNKSLLLDSLGLFVVRIIQLLSVLTIHQSKRENGSFKKSVFLFQLSQLETPEKGLTVQGNLSSLQEAASFESSRQYEISQFNEQHSYSNKQSFSDKFRSSLQRYSSGMSVKHSQQCGYSFVFLKTAVFKTRSPKCVVKNNSIVEESAQRSWITRISRNV
jgi:hypothetical protein